MSAKRYLNNLLPKEKKMVSKKKLKRRYVEAGFCYEKTKWYWDKDEKAWCLPLKEIVLSEV